MQHFHGSGVGGPADAPLPGDGPARMFEAHRRVLAHLARAARARRRRRALRHAAAGVTLVAGLLATSAVALALVPSLRPWMLVALASSTAVALGMTLGALLRPATPSATARWIARRAPVLGGALADGVEFAGRLQRGERIPTGSDELALAHVTSAAALADHDDPRRHARALAPPPWRSAAALTVAAAALLMALPSGRRVLLFGPPPAPPPRVTYGPVELRYRHPAYLAMPDRTEVGTGDVEAPVGTHVDVTVHADRPLASARLEPTEGSAVEMTLDGAAARGTLVVTRPGAYRIALRGSRGEIDPEPPLHVVRVIEDAAPVVRLRSPRRDTELDDGEPLGIAWSAEDDHGIVQAEAVVRRASSDETLPAGAQGEGLTRIPLGTFDPPEPQHEDAVSLAPEQLGLLPGETAWLWIEARDDDQVTGPKWAASSRVRVTLRSPDEQESAIEQGQEELAERLLALLGTHLVNGPDRLKDAAAVADAHRDFVPKLAAIVTLAGTLADASRDRMDDLAGSAALEDMRARLESMSRSRQRRAEALTSGEPQALVAHEQIHAEEILELERDVLVFDMWADRRASLRATDAAEDLRAAAEALSELAERVPEAAARELLAAADDVAASLAALQPLVQQLAQASGADPAAAREARQGLDAMSQASQGLRKRLGANDRSTASRDAARMARMAEDLAGIVGDLADPGAAGDPELAAEMERLEGDLRRLRRDQADLRDETNRVREDARKALSPEDLQRAEEGFAELSRLAKDAVAAHARGEKALGSAPGVEQFFRGVEQRDQLEERARQLLSGASLTEEGARELAALQRRLAELAEREIASSGRVESLMRSSQGSREMLGRLSQVIEDRDLARARMPARFAAQLLQGLRDDVETDDEPSVRATEPEFRTALAKTTEIIDKLESLEQQLDRASSSAMTSAQKQQLQQLGDRQGRMQARARDLAGKLRDLGADAPFLDQEVADRIDEAGGYMGDATSGLFGRKPGSASESQGEAVARLDDAAKALSPTGDRTDGRRGSRGRKGEGSEGPGPRPGGGREGSRESRGRMSRDRVEIPDADAYRVPKEFREEILEAMRESSAPDGYAEQVREYYRRLVE